MDYILGISGGLDSSCVTTAERSRPKFTRSRAWNHDAAAVLLKNGKVVFAIEEERLNRLKHTNSFPALAIRACLNEAKLSLNDVDKVAYYSDERHLNRIVRHFTLNHPRAVPIWTADEVVNQALSRDLGQRVANEKLEFVEHHVAHATSAYAVSNYEKALVVTLDGIGDGLSGSVSIGEDGQLTRLSELAAQQSLGIFYTHAIGYLGYSQFDEYKVMGLAPYGHVNRFAKQLEQICRVSESGLFELDLQKLEILLEVVRPRRAGDPFEQEHMDLAAGIQDIFERAFVGYISYFQRETGLHYLCLAGGVAQNSSAIGSLIRRNLFKGIFVQPASYDAGCALGAAIYVHQRRSPGVAVEPVRDVYWGTDIGGSDQVRSTLRRWEPLITVERVNVAIAADAIANGAILGWVQGRSEFGARALGNRSILADPRPLTSKTRVNEAIKQRESYRPFAPAVLEEYAAEFFDLPSGTSAEFMTYVAPVKHKWRGALEAITHIDGTARLQTVSKSSNTSLWQLINQFRKITGIPILLNTSFNHNVEPIVDSIDDAIACFLTTGLDQLVVGDWLIRRGELTRHEGILRLAPCLPLHIRLTRFIERSSANLVHEVFGLDSGDERFGFRRIEENTYRVLSHENERLTTEERCFNLRCDGSIYQLSEELHTLWSERLIRLLPPTQGAQVT